MSRGIFTKILGRYLKVMPPRKGGLRGLRFGPQSTLRDKARLPLARALLREARIAPTWWHGSCYAHRGGEGGTLLATRVRPPDSTFARSTRCTHVHCGRIATLRQEPRTLAQTDVPQALSLPARPCTVAGSPHLARCPHVHQIVQTLAPQALSVAGTAVATGGGRRWSAWGRPRS